MLPYAAVVRASDLLRLRRSRGAGAWTLGLAAAALVGYVALRLNATADAEVAVDAAFWSGMLCAAWAGIRTLDKGLLSDQARRLVTLGVDGGAVARYHLALSVLDVSRALLVAAAAVGPWLDALPQAATVLIAPGLTAAVLGVAAHVLAGEALDEGRNEGLKKALGGKFGAAEAAPLLYSGGGALAGAGVGAVLLSAALKDWAGGGPGGPLWVIVAAHAGVAAWAARNAIGTYQRSFHAVVPRILEVAAPVAGVPGERPGKTPTARIARKLGGLNGAVAWKDALQVRRAHRLDLPVRMALVAAILIWGPGAGTAPLYVALAWAALVVGVLPTAARAVRPALAPRWLERSLALPGTGALGVAIVWDLPILAALAWAFGPVAGVAALAAGSAAHGVMRLA